MEPKREDPGCEGALFRDFFARFLTSVGGSQKDRDRACVEIVSAVMDAFEQRDHESAGHSYRVAYYAVTLALEVGVSGEELRAIEWGSLLHDVGKIAVPGEILRKPGPLTEREWEIVRQHPVWGAQMLRDVEPLRPALDIVLCHHERWDGRGYPRGLRRESTPLSARIFSLVDTYDAITSDRPYRRARGHQDAVEELRRVAGSQHDPRLTEVFLALPQQRLRRLRTLSRTPACSPAQALRESRSASSSATEPCG